MKSVLKVIVLAVGLTAVATPALANGPGPFHWPWRGVAAALHVGRAVVAPAPVVVAPARAVVPAVAAPAPRWNRWAHRSVAPWLRPGP